MSVMSESVDSDQDQEVADVLAQGDDQLPNSRLGFCDSATSSASSTPSRNRPGLSPFRPPTALSNAPRNNTATVTPTITQITTVHQMAGRGEVSYMKELLKQHDTNEPDEFGLTPLMWATANDQINMVRYLLEEGADCDVSAEIQETALHLAANRGCNTVLKILLENSRRKINQRTLEGNTALIYAVYQNHKSCVRTLLENGADLLVENNRGQSALHLASLLGFKDIQLLIDDYLLTLLEPGDRM